MKHSQAQSGCPINFTLEMLGNRWTFLIVRDIVFYGKHTYGEFLASKEGITTNMLAERLAALEQEGVVSKRRSVIDKRKENYFLTEKGCDLIPVLIELGNWGLEYNQMAGDNEAWLTEVRTNRDRLLRVIRETVKEGGSVYVGKNNVLDKLGIPATF